MKLLPIGPDVFLLSVRLRCLHIVMLNRNTQTIVIPIPTGAILQGSAQLCRHRVHGVGMSWLYYVSHVINIFSMIMALLLRPGAGHEVLYH